MLLKYTGPAGRRIVGEHEWNEENGFLVDVADAELVAVLLTEPRGGFKVDEQDPLAVLIGSAQVAGELALHGIVKPKDLPKAGSKRGRELAEQFSSTELRQALAHLHGERHVIVAVKDSGTAADEVE
ncbi:MAG TPA: hypothetical protein VLE70_09500 [Anaerolineae bacterium]|jgi:hypothetical protein|nr:hypothetical protein [Anaerolineae bacterium]